MADANLFSEYLKPVRSVADYAADLDKQEGNALELTAKRASVADDAAIRKAYSAGGGDTNKIQQLLQQGGQYKAAQAMAKTQLDNQKTQSEITKNTAQSDHFTQQSTASVAEQKYKAASHHADGLAYVQTPDDVKTYISQGIAKGVLPPMTPEQIQVKLGQYASVDAFKQAATQAAIPVLEQYKSAALDERGRLDRENRVLTTQMGNDTSIQNNATTNATTQRGQNMTDGRARDALATSVSKPFEVTGPDGISKVLVQQDKAGKITPVQGYLPKAATDKPLTETQGNATNFAARMKSATDILLPLEDQGLKSGGVNTKAAGSGYTNFMATPAGRQYNQAQENWLTANLRKESGAVIGDSEMAREKAKYFGVYGDDAETLAQKRQARAVAEEGMMVQAGPGAKTVQGTLDKTSRKPEGGKAFDADKESRYQAWKAGQAK